MSVVALLDADVLVNAAIRDTLLRAAERDMYRLALTDQILTEMQRALEDNLGRTRDQTTYLVSEIRRSFEGNIVEGYEGLMAAVTNHPKDRHVLAAAVRAGAEIIVTFNTQDFPAAACTPYGIEGQRPATFLLDLWDRDPTTMAAIIVDQAADLTGWTVERLIARLAQDAPEFAAAAEASGLTSSD
jgi:predicted nucleic acid-binding protein